jgi:hypothetical protein
VVFSLQFFGSLGVAKQKFSRKENARINEAIFFCLSMASMSSTELIARVETRSGMPNENVRMHIAYLTFAGIIKLDNKLRCELPKPVKHTGHKTDLCGIPHGKYYVRDTLMLGQPIRCSCCGATLILTEYSSVMIKATMAIPRLYRLMCPECP